MSIYWTILVQFNWMWGSEKFIQSYNYQVKVQSKFRAHKLQEKIVSSKDQAN